MAKDPRQRPLTHAAVRLLGDVGQRSGRPALSIKEKHMGSRHGWGQGWGLRLLALGLGLLAVPGGSRAQTTAPDLRAIKPFIAIVVDSSGSMERLPGCVCSTKSCTECLPDCSLPNDATGQPPAAKKNRWAVTLEALTGTFENFECRALDRETYNGVSYDLHYFMPYHQPWDCTASDISGGSSCKAYPSSGTSNAIISQKSDGILDAYSGRVRFGLMTFDGWGTYQGAEPLVAHSSFNSTKSATAEGLWSYGSYDAGGGAIFRKDGTQPGRFHYPNCATDYMIDTGVRGPQAPEGGLVSLNTALCATPPCDSGVISDAIQERLLDTRPYGGTPIAASLDDLYHHINADLGTDAYATCRSRYGLLITDGYPDDDYRAFGCDCTQNTDPTAPGYCGGGSNNPSDMYCPYPLPEAVAYDLVNGRAFGATAQDNPPLQQLYVVGLSIADPAVRTRLNLIAQQGNSPQQANGDYALFADDGDPLTNDLDVLRSTIDAIVSQTIEPVSRSVPLFVRGKEVPQYEISTGFDIASRAGDPYMGFVERKRYTCQGSTVVEQDLTPADKFHDVLTSQSNRRLLTVNAGVGSNDTLINTTTCVGCSMPTSLASLGPQDLGLASTDTATRDATMDWMYGNPGSPREKWKISDIYHSSPVVVTSPAEDTGDEAFNNFRRRAEVADRPLTLLINSNDGILHAFAVEDWSPTSTPAPGPSVTAGQEMWGFVPPMFLDDLPAQLIQHQLTMDGTPVIKDVYFRRTTGSTSGSDYHTVVITGMRAGGKGYIALDLTNVHEPKFLWQFIDDGFTGVGASKMGFTYGQAAITQGTYKMQSGSVKQGAVAILPGGVGTKGIGTGCNASTMQQNAYVSSLTGVAGESLVQPTTAAARVQHRKKLPCWTDEGRSLYFVDVETGQLIKKIDESVFTAPLVGTPAVFTNEVGTSATRAYVMDANGVLWRIDMSETDPAPNDMEKGWTARPFHDLFYDELWDSTNTAINQETTYEMPLLSTGDSGEVVVIVGTGDTDNFEKTTVRNRLYSLTEMVVSQASHPADSYMAAVNWEMRAPETSTSPTKTSTSTPSSYKGFEMSELITGRMVLREGQLFAGTYVSVPSADPCDVGVGRFWSLSYNQADVNEPTGSGTFGPLRIPEDPMYFNVDVANAIPDLLVMGLALVEQPDCTAVQNSFPDPVFGNYTAINTGTPPATFLVAQGSGSAATRVANSALRRVSMQVQTHRAPAVITSLGGAID